MVTRKTYKKNVAPNSPADDDNEKNYKQDQHDFFEFHRGQTVRCLVTKYGSKNR